MISMRHLTKKHGARTAVEALTLEVRPGRVTGFLGPNGAGKSTTMRMVMGLDAPTSGQALVNGRPYAELRHPLREAGALLDPRSAHPGRSARAHLTGMARSNGIPAARVTAVLDTVGLAAVAGRRVGSFSLGMRQRLGIAAALLGDPPVLLLDEPVNGLDPDGVRWLRELVRGLAAEGRTVFLSSHLMSEMQETADHVVVIGRGRLIADEPIASIIERGSRNTIRIRSPRLGDLLPHLAGEGLSMRPAGGSGGDAILVLGGTLAAVGDLAFRHGVPVHELSQRRASLEEAYMELTASSVEYGERDPA
ncbi:ABC transporter ATP-binding protein [Streptomyces hainanensis]|uniref:ATP-binding cassette domain-containing protein n=1 Tax=Streptomyces hainanensis TaxID=402648 RepID=A0A4R4T0I2_9ACTN|nr:ATP-binding cassette domain-containing protein [Streptomyces hainanensis]TDC70261.1 ATP-binding cassette domain-containing protein [Streptomyces hainanensis]